jgi:acetyltransferase
MSTRNLDKLMAPKSVVAIGASERPGSVGAAVTRNLLSGGFKGDIHLVNRKGGEIQGRPVRRSLSEVLSPPDLAVVMTPAASVPGILRELGEKGTKAAVVVSAGPGAGAAAGEENAHWRNKLLRTAEPHLLRILGPNCIGYVVPPRASVRAWSGPAGWRRSPSRARSWRRWPTGAARTASASRTSSPWATWPTSISATCST